MNKIFWKRIRSAFFKIKVLGVSLLINKLHLEIQGELKQTLQFYGAIISKRARK